MIDWKRMARPQADGYDTQVLLDAARARWPGLVRKLEWPKIEHSCGDRMDDLEELCVVDDPLLAVSQQALTRWPAGATAFCLIDGFTPLRMIGWGGGRGCTSGHTHPDQTDGRIVIFASLDDPIGGAEGIVHETAHQRLHVMGIDLERHDGRLLLGQDPVSGGPDLFYPQEPGWFYGSHRYFSPIRRDVPRPMSALIHGVYAYTAVLEVDLANAGAEYLAINVPKVRMGAETIRQSVQTTREGTDFINGFMDWASDAVGRGEELLRASNIDEVPVPAPEWEVNGALA